MLSFMLIPLALVAVLLAVIYLYLTANYDHWKKRGVPGPKPLPLFGTFPNTITGKRNIVYDIDDIYRQFKNKAKFVGVFFTRSPVIMLIDPAMVKEVLINNFKSFMDNESSLWMDAEVEPLSSRNPFTLRGNEWKIKRAEIVPGLTVSRIKLMYPVIERGAKELVKFLRNNPEDRAAGIETKNLAMKFTGEVVADLGWGIEVNAFQKEDCTFVKMAHKMVHNTFKKISYLMIVELFPFVKRLYYVRFFPEMTDKFFTKLTEMSLKLRNAGDDRQDFLGHVLQVKEKKNLSMDEVVAHNLTFLLDGFETSAGLISHCLLLLARHPEQQEKLRKELLESSREDGSISYDDLLKLPYLDQVMSETLRIFVPLAFMSKICTEPFEFTNTDGSKYQVQKDDLVLISTYSYHHDEEYYPEPEKFIPERFDEDNGGTRKYKDLGVFFPFGDGPRICIGMKFGLSQAKTAVAEVIKHFRLTVDESRTISDNVFDTTSFIMSVEGGIYIRYEDLTK